MGRTTSSSTRRSGTPSVTITWRVLNANNVTISGPGFTGLEVVPATGTRTVSLPSSLAATTHQWKLDAVSHCGGATVAKTISALVLSIPIRSVKLVEPLFTDQQLRPLRGRQDLAMFRVYVEDGIGSGGGTGVDADLVVRITSPLGFSAVLGPHRITTRHPGDDDRAIVGHVFTLPLAAIQSACLDVVAEVTWASPTGTAHVIGLRALVGKNLVLVVAIGSRVPLHDDAERRDQLEHGIRAQPPGLGCGSIAIEDPRRGAGERQHPESVGLLRRRSQPVAEATMTGKAGYWGSDGGRDHRCQCTPSPRGCDLRSQ